MSNHITFTIFTFCSHYFHILEKPQMSNHIIFTIFRLFSHCFHILEKPQMSIHIIFTFSHYFHILRNTEISNHIIFTTSHFSIFQYAPDAVVFTFFHISQKGADSHFFHIFITLLGFPGKGPCASSGNT